jgi:hypothetical protein
MLYSDDAGRQAFLGDIRAFVGGQAVAMHDFPQAIPRARGSSPVLSGGDR